MTILFDAYKLNYLVLAGYLKKVNIPIHLGRSVVNIHPSLLPKYGGKGMYGNRVHQAVLDSGDVETGCTVHYVDSEYDHGETILQNKCPVLPGDTVKSLSARVFALEIPTYIAAIQDLQV